VTQGTSHDRLCRASDKRQMLAAVDATHIEVGLLPDVDDIDLMAQVIGGGRVAAEPSAAIQAALRGEQLRQPAVVTTAYAASARPDSSAGQTQRTGHRPARAGGDPFWSAPGR